MQYLGPHTAASDRLARMADLSAGGGDLVKIQRVSMSLVAAVDFTWTNDGTYAGYIFQLSNINPTGTFSGLAMQAFLAGVLNTGNIYGSMPLSVQTGATTPTGAGALTAQSTMILSQNMGAVATDGGTSGRVTVMSPEATTHKLLLTETAHGLPSNAVGLSVAAGRVGSTTAMTGLRFMVGAGTFRANGTIDMYGIKKP